MKLYCDRKKAVAKAFAGGCDFDLISEETVGARNGFSFGLMRYDDVHVSSPHDDQEVIYVLSGAGLFNVAGQRIEFGPGFAIYIPEKTEHCLETIIEGPVECICVHSGYYCS